MRRGGELYGTIGHETKGLGYVVVLVRKDGLRMRIPLRVGETNKEAFAALISLLTLKFLWSKEWPENRCRIIDPEISTLISDHDRITNFALSLYLFVSVYGERTLGGSGG